MATACVSGSGSCCLRGRAFVGTAEECSKALESLKKIVSEYGFADIEQKRQWKVYQAKVSGHSHHSVVFQDVEKGNGFFVHIRVICGQVVFEVKYLSTQVALNTLGMIEKTAEEILNISLQRAEKHGEFNELTNNCQTFCTNLAVDVGVKGYRTDQGKSVDAAKGVGVVGGIVGGVALVIIGGLAAIGAAFARK